MKHLILGTAGHVDHGKTALVRALTGIECDTHKEERERGITIHLGFAHLPLSNGGKLAIIDVPGHRDFIHTMVSGASGIDLVLLVIAADNGVMPQTREHVQIMEILGIRQGIVVLTKTDLVDAEFLDLCEADVREFLDGTFLAKAHVMRVSAKTGAGLDDLRRAIDRMADQVRNRPAEGLFRLYIDRIFSVSGFGTVVTGTVIGGRLRKEDPVFLLGRDARELRVRRLERHGEEVAEVQAGDRASLNLVGLDRSEFRRGMLLADRPLPATTLVDATLTVYAPDAELPLWSHLVLHAGTAELQARVHLIDRDRVGSKESALVQIHLQEPSFLQRGDRFVVRNSSCDLTIGGGEIVDAAPLHHRRRPERLVRELSLIAKSRLDELVAAEVRKAPIPLTLAEVAAKLNVAPDSIARAIAGGPLRGVTQVPTKEGPVLVSATCLDALRGAILAATGDHRKRNPLSARGIDLDELRSHLRLQRRAAHDEVILSLVRGLLERQKLRESSGTWFLFDDDGAVDPRLANSVAVVEEFLRGCGMQTPLMSEIKALASRKGLGDKELGGILHHLVQTGKVVKVEDNYLHHTVVDDCRRKLVARLQERPAEGVKVSDFRDLVQGNRKICLLLLARFDEEGVTRREGDFRFLKEARHGS